MRIGFFTITGSASISETDFNELIAVFPNPATDLIQVINTTNSPLLFQLMDQLGSWQQYKTASLNKIFCL